MGLSAPLPMDRVHLVNPGQTIGVGDRTLTAMRPPTFDNPITTGLYDDRSGALFSADCFGALLAEVPQRAEDLSDDELHQGQVFWATVDSPWLHTVDPPTFDASLDEIRRAASRPRPEQPSAGSLGRHVGAGCCAPSGPCRPRRLSSGRIRRRWSR